MNDHYLAAQEPVIIVGAGPVGCTAALPLVLWTVTLLAARVPAH